MANAQDPLLEAAVVVKFGMASIERRLLAAAPRKDTPFAALSLDRLDPVRTMVAAHCLRVIVKK